MFLKYVTLPMNRQNHLNLNFLKYLMFLKNLLNLKNHLNLMYH